MNKYNYIEIYSTLTNAQTIQMQQGPVGFWWTWYCIAQTGILYMGPGRPNSSWVQQLGGSVCAWCWVLVASGKFIAKIAKGLEI